MSEPQVGMVSYFKVYAGTMKPGDELYNMDHQVAERVNQLFVAEGKNRVSVDELRAGDIGVTVKLKDSHTNDTLATKGTTKKLRKFIFQNPELLLLWYPQQVGYGKTDEGPSPDPGRRPHLAG